MENLNPKRNLNSLYLSIYLTSTCLSSIISSFISIPYISVLIICLLSIHVILNNKNLHILKYDFLYFVILAMFISLSFFLNGGKAFDYLLHYYVFGLSALLISNIEVDGNKVVMYIVLIYTLYCIVYFFKIQHVFIDDKSNQMGLAYSCVPGVLVGYIAYKHRNAFNRTIVFLSLFVILCSAWIILFKTITRGAILAVIIGIPLLYYIGTDKKNKKKVICSSIIIIPIAVYFVVEAFSLINSSSIGAVNKLSRLMEGGDVSNGRYDLWKSAIDIISDKPLFGHGSGYFEKLNDSSYPHQLILQILCEFGCIGAIVILVPLYSKLRLIFNNKLSLGKLLFAAYFIYAFILLMFSNSFWLFPIFWFLYFNNFLLRDKVSDASN